MTTMKWGLLASMFIGSFLPLIATADEIPAWLTERRIIGKNDLEPIENAKGTPAYDLARIVARVETRGDGDGFCTSSRVGEDLFLTNFHCYDYVPCEEIQFHLGYERDLPANEQLLFACKEVLSTSLPFDYALYRVEFLGTVASVGITKTYAYGNLGLAIPDNDATGIEKTFTIAATGNLSDLKVALKLTHPHIADLTIELVSPAGTSVVLSERAGGDGQNLDQTFGFDDGLVALKGEDPQGVWKLQIKDLAADNVGTLNEVVFTVTTGQIDTQQGDAPDFAPADYPVATLWDGPIVVDQPLIVASHPAARLKEIDRSETCKLRTIAPEAQSERQTITHTCDTEGGSSGSPVLDRATGNIVALHWGGQDSFNMAIPITKVLGDIRQHVAPEVMAELHVAGEAQP